MRREEGKEGRRGVKDDFKVLGLSDYGMKQPFPKQEKLVWTGWDGGMGNTRSSFLDKSEVPS